MKWSRFFCCCIPRHDDSTGQPIELRSFTLSYQEQPYIDASKKLNAENMFFVKEFLILERALVLENKSQRNNQIRVWYRNHYQARVKAVFPREDFCFKKAMLSIVSKVKELSFIKKSSSARQDDENIVNNIKALFDQEITGKIDKKDLCILHEDISGTVLNVRT